MAVLIWCDWKRVRSQIKRIRATMTSKDVIFLALDRLMRAAECIVCFFAERAMVVGCLGQAPLTYHSTKMKCMAADRAQRFTTS